MALYRLKIPFKKRGAGASRINALGFRSNADGWPVLGKRRGKIAASMNVELDAKGKLRCLVWKSGRLDGLVYGELSKLKSAIGKGRG